MTTRPSRSRSRARLLAVPVIALLAFAPVVSGCSSDTKDNAKDTVESAGDDIGSAADKVGARATAEAFRASLKGNDTAEKEGLRSVKALNEVVKGLPGDPDISGIADGTGDGLDDDGKVQVDAGDEQACITIPETGTDTTVDEGAC